MTVALDSVFESHSGTVGDTNSSSFYYIHYPVGTIRGILVFVLSTDGTNPTNGEATSVTYGGYNVPAVPGGVAKDTAGEPGAVQTFFLGSDIPAGAQQVNVNRNNNAMQCYAVSIAVTAAMDTMVAAAPVLLQEDGVYSEQVVSSATAASALRFAAGYSGGSGTLPAGAYSQTTGSAGTIAFGLYSFTTGHESTGGTGGRNVGFDYATVDDRAAVHLAVAEVFAEGTAADTLAAATSAASGTAAWTFAGVRQAIINGLTSGGSEAAGWNATVKPAIQVTDVVRTSGSIITITLPAVSGYDIGVQESVTATVPAAALSTYGAPVAATPTATIYPSSVSGSAYNFTGDSTGSASGTVTAIGTAADSTADATSVAVGLLTSPGAAVSVLAAATSESSGVVTVKGPAASTLGAATSSGTAVENAIGTGANTLADAVNSASGFVGGIVFGSAVDSLSAASASASGSVSWTFAGTRQYIIDGLVSAQSETDGWNARVKMAIPVANVARTSSTVVTITLPAVPGYNILSFEDVTATVPAFALATGTQNVVATPTAMINPSGMYGTISATLAAAVSAASGTSLTIGTGSDLLAATLFSSTLSVVAGIAGPAASVLATATVNAIGRLAGIGSAANSLAPATTAASGSVTATGTIAGTAASQLVNSTSAASGKVTVTGSIAATLADTRNCSGVGVVATSGTILRDLQSAASSASGVIATGGLGASTLDAALSDGVGGIYASGTAADQTGEARSDGLITVGDVLFGIAADTLADTFGTADGQMATDGTCHALLVGASSSAGGVITYTELTGDIDAALRDAVCLAYGINRDEIDMPEGRTLVVESSSRTVVIEGETEEVE